MTLVCAAPDKSAVHRRRIQDLLDKNAALTKRVGELVTKVNKHKDLKNEIKDCRSNLRWAQWRNVSMQTDILALERKIDGLKYDNRLLTKDLVEATRQTPGQPQSQGYMASTTASLSKQTWFHRDRPTRDYREYGDTWDEEYYAASHDEDLHRDSTPPSSAAIGSATPSFMRSTASSRAKAAVLTAAAPQKAKEEHPEAEAAGSSSSGMWSDEDLQPDEEYAEARWGSMDVIERAEATGVPPSITELTDEAWGMTLEKRLGRNICLTQWTDATWLQGPAGGVRLPSKFVKATQLAALDLAAEALYAWGMRHAPDEMRAWAPEGPCDLRLDRESLIGYGMGVYNSGRVSGDFFYDHSPSKIAGRVQDPYRLAHIVFNGFGRDLRNRTYHYYAVSASEAPRLHRLVYPVLEFAEAVRDEDCAARVRDLLLRVRREAEATYAEIEGLSLLSVLPEARAWAHHHEVLFGDVLERWNRPYDVKKGGVYRYGSAVVRAALVYKERGGRRGMGRGLGLDWSYEQEEQRRTKFLDVCGYRHYGLDWYADGMYWDDVKVGSVPGKGHRIKWSPLLEPAEIARRRRHSMHGADLDGMARADTKAGRWKRRRDPRPWTLGWVDLAVKF